MGIKTNVKNENIPIKSKVPNPICTSRGNLCPISNNF